MFPFSKRSQSQVEYAHVPIFAHGLFLKNQMLLTLDKMPCVQLIIVQECSPVLSHEISWPCPVLLFAPFPGYNGERYIGWDCRLFHLIKVLELEPLTPEL
jgi:hypothetical protein